MSELLEKRERPHLSNALFIVMLLSMISIIAAFTAEPCAAQSVDDVIVFSAMTSDPKPVEVTYAVLSESDGTTNGTVAVHAPERPQTAVIDYSERPPTAISADTEGPVTIPAVVRHGGKEYDVTEIEKRAFYYCEAVNEVRLPGSITTIGDNAFEDCKKLTSLDIPELVHSIGQSAFEGCSGLTDIRLPKGLSTIDRNAFDGCSNLKRIDLPEALTAIQYEVFNNCTGLKELHIPANVSNINFAAFRGTENHMMFTVDPGNATYQSIDGILYNKEISELLFCPRGRIGKVEGIPDSVVCISSPAFEGCNRITEVNLPGKLISIDGGFTDCSSLREIIIPETVTRITAASFFRCDALKNITIPKSVVELGSHVFSYSDSMTAINVDQENPNYASVDGVLYDKALTTLLEFPSGKESFEIAPETLTEIADEAFASNGKIRVLSFPEGVKRVGANMFYFCDKLTSVVFPESLERVGDRVLNFGQHLMTVSFRGKIPPFAEGEESLISSRYEDLTIYIPTGTAGDYKTAFGSRVSADSSEKVLRYIERDFADDNGPYIRFFSDVPADKWYADSVNKATSMLIVSGIGENLYEPERTVTRAEFVQMVNNALVLPEDYAVYIQRYKDVEYMDWFQRAVNNADERGLLAGFPEENFYPERMIRREEMASILSAVIEHKLPQFSMETVNPVLENPVDLGSLFTDADMISPNFHKDVQKVVGFQWMRGMPDRTFSPNGLATRAEAAAVLVNLAEMLGESRLIPVTREDLQAADFVVFEYGLERLTVERAVGAAHCSFRSQFLEDENEIAVYYLKDNTVYYVIYRISGEDSGKTGTVSMMIYDDTPHTARLMTPPDDIDDRYTRWTDFWVLHRGIFDTRQIDPLIWNHNRVKQTDIDRLKIGMSKGDIEAILGPGPGSMHAGHLSDGSAMLMFYMLEDGSLLSMDLDLNYLLSHWDVVSPESGKLLRDLPPPMMKGDADLDGKVGISDISLTLCLIRHRYILSWDGCRYSSPIQMTAMDVNGDTVIDYVDVDLMFEHCIRRESPN